MSEYKEPTANLKKNSDWQMTVIGIVVCVGIMSVIGFSILGAVYDAKHPQPSTSKDDPLITMIMGLIPVFVILGGKLLTKNKKKTRYNSEGQLV